MSIRVILALVCVFAMGAAVSGCADDGWFGHHDGDHGHYDNGDHDGPHNGDVQPHPG